LVQFIEGSFLHHHYVIGSITFLLLRLFQRISNHFLPIWARNRDKCSARHFRQRNFGGLLEHNEARRSIHILSVSEHIDNRAEQSTKPHNKAELTLPRFTNKLDGARMDHDRKWQSGALEDSSKRCSQSPLIEVILMSIRGCDRVQTIQLHPGGWDV
jgi:hypothetical protein